MAREFFPSSSIVSGGPREFFPTGFGSVDTPEVAALKSAYGPDADIDNLNPEQLAAPIQEEPSEGPGFFKRSIINSLGAVDAAASLAHGVTMFPFHLGSQAIGFAEGALRPDVSGKELAEKYGGAVESVTMQPGMIENLFRSLGGKPQVGIEESAALPYVEPVSKAFETFLPTEKIQKNLARMKELGVPEGVADQTAFWWSKLIELTAFAGYHGVGKAGINKLNKKVRGLAKRIKSGKNTLKEGNDLISDIKKLEAENPKDAGQLEEVKMMLEDAIEREGLMDELRIAEGQDKASVIIERHKREARGDDRIEKLETQKASSVETEGGVEELRDLGVADDASGIIEGQRVVEGAERVDTLPGAGAEIEPRLAGDRARTNLEQKSAVEKQRVLQRELERKPVEEKVEVIPEFKSTGEAVKFGETATEVQVVEMEKLRKIQEDLSEKMLEAEDFDQGIVHATNSQLYREAIEGSRGEHPSQVKKVEPPFDPKSIKGEAEVIDLGQKRTEKVGEELHELLMDNLVEVKLPRLKAIEDAEIARLRPDIDVEFVSNNRDTGVITYKVLSGKNAGKTFETKGAKIIPEDTPVGELVEGDIDVSNIIKDYDTAFKGPDLKVIEGGKETLPTFADINEATLANFEVRTNRSFKTQEAAQKFLEKVFEREQKGETTKGVEPGMLLEVVKVKGKFRLAEAIDIAKEKLTFSEEFSDNLTPERRVKLEELKTEKPGEGFFDPKVKRGPDELSSELQELSPAIAEWLKSPKDKLIDPVENQLKAIGSELPKDHPMQAGIDKALRAINKKKAELGTEELVVPDATGPAISLDEALKNAESSETVINTTAKELLDRLGREEKLHPLVEETIDNFEWNVDIGDSLKRLNDILGEKGNISLEVLPADKVKSIKRLRDKARKSGKSLVDYLVDKGMTLVDAESISNLANQIKDPIREGKTSIKDYQSSATVESLSTGRILNGKKKRAVKVTRGGVEYTVKPLDVYEGWVRAMLKSNQPGKKLLGKLGEAFDPSAHVWDEIGGDFRELNYRDYKSRKKHARNMIKEERKELKALRKGVSRKERNNVMAYAIAQQKKGVEILNKMGITKIPTELSPKERVVYNALQSKFRDKWHYVNDGRVDIGKYPMRSIPNYFTFAQQISWAEKFGIKSNLGVEHHGILHERAQASDIKFRYAKARTKLGLPKIEMDPFRVYDRYMVDAINSTEISPVIARIDALRGTLIHPDTGKSFRLGRTMPRTDKFIQGWSNAIAGLKQFKLPKLVESGMRELNNNLTYAVLSGNARSAAIQVTALKNTVVEIGATAAVDGVVSIASHPIKWHRKAFKGNAIPERFDTSGYDANIVEALRRTKGKVGAAKRGVAQAALYPLKLTDLETAIMSWVGAYKQGRKLGMSDKLSMNYADDIVIKTQASGDIGDISPIQRSQAGRFVTLFQTFTINDFRFLTKDVLGIGNKKINNKTAVMKLSKFIAATTAFNVLMEDVIGINSPLPTPVRAVRKGIEGEESLPEISARVAMEFIELIPGLSSARYGGTPLGAGTQLIHDVFADRPGTGRPLGKTAKIIREGIQDDLPISDIAAGVGKSEGAKLAGSAMGIAGTAQVSKMLRARDRGESLYGQIMGTYSDKNSRVRGRKRSTSFSSGF